MTKTYNEALEESLKYFKGDSMAAEVFLQKYALKKTDKNGEEVYYEWTPDQMHHRLAKEFAKIEKQYGGENELSEEEIYELFKDFKYIVPGGSVMSGLGNNGTIESLSNCFVLGKPKDSYGSIMKYREMMVQVEKHRGGAGLDISDLRPEGSKVNNAARTSTGAVSFMEGFSKLSEEVAMNGRRGALMISINCKHPDIEKFIESKQDLTKITGANISVQFTDDFLEAVEKDENYYLRFPVDMEVVDVTEMKVGETHFFSDGVSCIKLVRAKDIWNKFIHCSWATAEPGIMFRDRHINYSPDGVYSEYQGVTTNPCGEINMDERNSCRLMNINFCGFIEDGKFNFEKLKDVSRKITRLGDDLVDLEYNQVNKIINHIKENYSDDDSRELELWEEISEKGIKSRRIGCGATGVTDAMALCGFNLKSEEGYLFEREMFSIKLAGELEEELLLAKERGAFFGWDFKKEFTESYDLSTGLIELEGNNDFYKFLLDFQYINDYYWNDYQKYGRRNVSWSTMAPTGSVSIMTQTSSGIEPLFSPWYLRYKKCSLPTDRVDFTNNVGINFTKYYVVHIPFKKWVIEHYSSEYNDETSFDGEPTEERMKWWDKWFKESPWYGNTASELTPLEHVKLQEIAQDYTSHSISKTNNLPESATESEINDIMMLGWKNGLKGLTVYRDKCRDGILEKTSKKDCNCKCNGGTLVHNAPKRPKSLDCDVKRFRNGGEKWIACIGLYNNQPYEIFTGLSEKLELPDYVNNCTILKNKIDKEILNEETNKPEMVKVSRYDLVYSDKSGESKCIENIGSVFRTEFEGYSRLLSGLLRHGMPIEYVVSTIKSLKFKNDTINSWKNGVIRALKSYVEDGEISGEVCPECGGKLIRESGCVRCSQCTYSRCS